MNKTIEEVTLENEALIVDVSYWCDRFNLENRLKNDLKTDKENLYIRIQSLQSDILSWQQSVREIQWKLADTEKKLADKVNHNEWLVKHNEWLVKRNEWLEKRCELPAADSYEDIRCSGETLDKILEETK
jgi:hypothetical protein